MIDLNKAWMASGAIGCTFAALFAKNPSKVNWETVVNPIKLIFPKNASLLSLQFPNKSKKEVFDWAIKNGFYEENTSEEHIGLRYKIGKNISWVQYFGPDSHVITRQAPIPELMLCIKLPVHRFIKVGFNGILHLAHASVEHMTKLKAERAWNTSFSKTKKLLGHAPEIAEAAKTTFIKSDIENG